MHNDIMAAGSKERPSILAPVLKNCRKSLKDCNRIGAFGGTGELHLILDRCVGQRARGTCCPPFLLCFENRVNREWAKGKEKGKAEASNSEERWLGRKQLKDCNRGYGNFYKEGKKPKKVKDYEYHKEKMMLCKQESKGISLSVEHDEWLPDTDEEPDEQELEAHYIYIAKIQEHWKNCVKNERNNPMTHDVKLLVKDMLIPLVQDTVENSLLYETQLKKEMFEDLNYVQSLEKEVDDVQKEFDEFKTDIEKENVSSRIDDILLQECLAKDILFTSTDGESIESYYHHFSKLMNNFKRNKHFPEKSANILKFLNNLQPEWSRHVIIVHQTKDVHTTDYTRLYDFLKYNQKEVDELRAERLAKTQDPLALMVNSNNPFSYLVFQLDLPSSSTLIQQPLPNNNYNPQPSFNQNYMQQPMPNPKDITDLTAAMNMALVLMAKAFKLNYSTPTNMALVLIAQPGMNLGQDNQMQMVR
uniref:Gag-Pol polyprotein n=1 Tax=Tanacetum cinerariifolium TaxID=118510 RepID=A0A699GM48_TANCI|nr:hypothetical protein [Tanacetum cinerariifolium]